MSVLKKRQGDCLCQATIGKLLISIEKREYYWEASEQHVKVAKILEKSYRLREAAREYEEKGKLLDEKEEYLWEAATAYDKAGGLYEKVDDLANAKGCYTKAMELFNLGGYEFESNKIRERLKKL